MKYPSLFTLPVAGMLACGGFAHAEPSAATASPLPALTIALPTTLADALMEDAPVAAPTSWREGWVGGVEGGLSGSSGNSDTLNFRVGVFANRITSAIETRFNASYAYAEDDGERSQNRGEANLRNDWLLGDTPWSVFAQGRVEVDEFQDWDVRLSGFVGVGYLFIRDERTMLRGRVGIGGAYVTGGIRDEWTTEGLLGLDYEHQLTERQRIFATGELYPSLEDGGEFRSLSRAGWEILVDPSINMSLRIGVEHRYDSEPGGDARKNDLDYFATIAFTF